MSTPSKQNSYNNVFLYYRYQLYMRIPSRVPNSTFYIRTLTPEFWYACIGVFMLLTVALRVTVRILNRVGWKYHEKNLEQPLSLPTCFLTISSGFFNQGTIYYTYKIA